MVDHRWILIVEFDEPPQEEHPKYECDAFAAHLMSMWGGLPEDFMEDVIAWTGTKFAIGSPILQALTDGLAWLLMNTVPKSVELKRVGER
jgi:hypothetical protein